MGVEMSVRNRLGVIILMSIAASSAAAWGAAEHARSFTIASTLAGKTVLPHRIHWLANPTGSSARIVEVDFLIDGRKSWIEKKAPYSYGDDGNWLVTSWLSPGSHRFTVRATAADGVTAQRTTIARVLPAAAPPSGLAGSWKRTVTQEQAGAQTPAGTWVLSVDKTGWKIRDPKDGGVFIDVAYLVGGRLQARGGIFTKPKSNFEGNGWCGDTNAPVNYRWAVSAGKLTLTLIGADACGPASDKQHFIWAGAWTRVP
jgi:hypothetical protein